MSPNYFHDAIFSMLKEFCGILGNSWEFLELRESAQSGRVVFATARS
jgi:hypothetical protein